MPWVEQNQFSGGAEHRPDLNRLKGSRLPGTKECWLLPELNPEGDQKDLGAFKGSLLSRGWLTYSASCTFGDEYSVLSCKGRQW